MKNSRVHRKCLHQADYQAPWQAGSSWMDAGIYSSVKLSEQTT